jgi:hypothetical protein
MNMSDENKKNPELQQEPSDDEAEAHGWDAITAAFETLYPGQTNPQHYGTLISWRLGGNDPLDGVSAYDGGDFWHFVTYGFSDLYEKETQDPEWSGFGFELTMKLKKTASVVLFDTDDAEIRNVAGILQSLARYVFDSGKCIAPYEYVYTGQTEGFDAHGQSKLTGFATLPDAAGTIETPNGKVEFVCVVGLTDRELKAIVEKEHTVKEVLELLPGGDLTDYSRADLL